MSTLRNAEIETARETIQDLQVSLARAQRDRDAASEQVNRLRALRIADAALLDELEREQRAASAEIRRLREAVDLTQRVTVERLTRLDS